jgi:ribosome maturation factor RimP
MALAEKIAELLAPVAESAGTRIARAAFADKTLRIYVEKSDGSSPDIDALAKLSRAFSAHLDVEDPIRDRYFLEVSSAGAKMTDEEFREILKKTKGAKNE